MGQLRLNFLNISLRAVGRVILPVVVGFIGLSSSSVLAANRCEALFSRLQAPVAVRPVQPSVRPVTPAPRAQTEAPRPRIERVELPERRFDGHTRELRDTLSGKLATVWRSEWKTKLEVSESNQYVVDMAREFLTPETREVVLAGLEVHSEGLVRQVHERIYRLQEAGRLKEADALLVRDMPPPVGAKDTTFTYYTKPIVNTHGEGKHQIRVRTYLREVSYEQIPEGQSVQGFEANGSSVVITKLANQSYRVETGIEATGKVVRELNLSEVQQLYGASARFFAPHGKSFKMEVKTALDDQISYERFPILGGNHMVQKLDVSLSPAQVARLFAPLTESSAAARRVEALTRIDSLQSEINAKNPDGQARTEAVFNVLKAGIEGNPDFLAIEGATAYHRTAFESKSGFQTTIDRDQGVYMGNMYASSSLKTPVETIRQNQMIATTAADARHVELKVPVTSIENTVGIQFHDPRSAPQPQRAESDASIVSAVGIYSRYVRNNDHSGKFNYIMKYGED
ncbi:hypothetical protein [Pseudobdellovibrio exovorus]|uniref:Uncharacterized protein n=1 Tax=Pseudobdellovibrio exovorus JSS TaxID=1184267 RepID=M4V863_9BACT|nr:hypothetical protein [Pseudobdellovibrio exovorus]AGH95403.1 hypothetical protein A11Q_1187 [Pseudobdellovibrio exovorus JSS]